MREVRRFPGLFLATVLLAYGSAVSWLVALLVLAHVIAQGLAETLSFSNALSQLGLVAGLAAARGLLGLASDWCAQRLSSRVRQALRAEAVQGILQAGPVPLAREPAGEVVSALSDGVEGVDALVREYVPRAVLAVAVPLTVLGYVVFRDPLSGLILFLTGPLIPMFMILIGMAAGAMSRKQWQAMARLSARFLDVVQGMVTLKTWNAVERHLAILADSTDEFRRRTLAVLRVAFLSAFALELIGTISTAIVAVIVGLRLLHGRMEFPEALAVLVLTPEFYAPLRAFGMAFHAGVSGRESLVRLKKYLQPEGRRTQVVGGADDGIVLEDVSAGYGGSPVVSGVSFVVHKGERVALVGPSGAGKSTVFNLLLGFLEPMDGRVGSAPIAWLPQSPYLFAGTILENITMGLKDVASEKLSAAIRAAHLEEVLNGLPDGLATRIGEQGVRLSGGQAQRVAVARAFLRDAPVLLLDEPTTHLDEAGAEAVLAALEDLMHGRTVLMITHRLESLTAVNRILVLDGGRLVAQGTHAELQTASPLYRNWIASVERV